MKLSAALLVLTLVVAVAGWARAGDDSKDLTERVKALEQRIALLDGRPSSAISAEVRTRRLVVEDEKARDRIVLTAKESQSSLTIRDAAGVERLQLIDGDGASRLWFRDRDGKQGLWLFLLDNGSAILGMGVRSPSLNDRRNPELLLEAPVDGAVGMGLWGGPGKQNETSVAGIWIWQDGTIAWGGGPRSAGKAGFHLKYPKGGAPEFTIRDPNEALIWEMPKGK